MAIEGQQVTVRPRSTSAEMSSCGPWQMAATGLAGGGHVSRQVDHRVPHAHALGGIPARE